MAGEPPFYTEIDGAWHTIDADEVTVCGLALPYPGAVWQRDVPATLHCRTDAQGEESDEVDKTVAEPAEATKVTAKSATRKATKAK